MPVASPRVSRSRRDSTGRRLRASRLLLKSNSSPETLAIFTCNLNCCLIMPDPHFSNVDEVDHLLLNAELRDALEPFSDESVDIVDVRNMSTPEENEFLASMLAWERAPVLPIAQWFQPELVLAPPDPAERVRGISVDMPPSP